MSISFQNMPIHSAIDILARFSGKNIICNDDVKGRISFNLQEVNADQALETIIDSQGLYSRRSHHILFISKFNPPTLHAEDTPVPQTPTGQVHIATRIVNIDSDYENELGIRFSTINAHLTTSSLKPENNYSEGDDPIDRLHVDLPGTENEGGQLGLALFRLAKGTLIDLELSALESEGHAKIISRPELIAANQQSAIIESGQEIPYQEKTSSGATSITFKKAVLSLKVTPQIIPGGKILLHLQVNQDSRSSKEVLGVPAIDTREISTEVIVNDRQTVALGGIYEESESHHVQRVPFLASLPLVGALFRYREIERNKRELMIFVTPTIIT